MTEPRTSVIVVNYNGAHLLPDCLTALSRQRAEGLEFETIVVDNASSDGSRELLARNFPWVRVIASPTNLGFAGGNNLALDQLTTQYAVLLNNDATPEPGWLRNLISVLDEPGNHSVGIATGKILFMPKFARIRLQTPAFRPGPQDTRDLGVRFYKVAVDGTAVTEKVLWEHAAYGPEGSGPERFRWTRPDGEFLLPVPASTSADGVLAQPVKVTISAAAEVAKDLTLHVGDRPATVELGDSVSDVTFELEPGTAVVDVINNAGSIVLQDGSGADRGFQDVDRGQYEEPDAVFAACGNGMALRTAVGRELGWFDDAFFMYYEDTDLSWRWQAQGWTIRYVPSAVLRHIHAASSKEWSPSWVFHVERNRLLMLTKNATPRLACRAVSGYVKDSVRQLAHVLRDALRLRRRPALRELRSRGRVMRSYLRQAPRALRIRRKLRRTATVPAAQLQQWLVTRK